MLDWLLDTSYGISYDAWTLALGLGPHGRVAGVAARAAGRAARAGGPCRPVAVRLVVDRGFGLAFVARFWVLSVDAVTYGDLSSA